MKGIADSGFLVAFVSRNDRHHDWAASLAEDQTEPLLTCESVLTSRPPVLPLVGPFLAVGDETERTTGHLTRFIVATR